MWENVVRPYYLPFFFFFLLTYMLQKRTKGHGKDTDTAATATALNSVCALLSVSQVYSPQSGFGFGFLDFFVSGRTRICGPNRANFQTLVCTRVRVPLPAVVPFGPCHLWPACPHKKPKNQIKTLLSCVVLLFVHTI